VAAAVIVAAVIGISLVQRSTPAVAATVRLHAVHEPSGSGQATIRHISGGWAIQLTVKHLPQLSSAQFYECWYAGPNDRPGHLDLIAAGTFTAANGRVNMESAANPAKFKIMQITIEQPGDASQHGQVILQGTAQPA
jgi:hypothetical protein